MIAGVVVEVRISLSVNHFVLHESIFSFWIPDRKVVNARSPNVLAKFAETFGDLAFTWEWPIQKRPSESTQNFFSSQFFMFLPYSFLACYGM